MKYQVNISGGAGSTLAAIRAVEQKGADACHLVFADTGSEDPTLYDGIAWLEDHLGLTIERVGAEKNQNIWTIFHKERGFRFRGGCKASLELKHKPLKKHLLALGGPAEVVVVMGLGWEEPERIQGTATRRGWNERMAPYKLWNPLCEAPFLSHCEMVRKLEKLGWPSQALYHKHFAHNNCGGGCILAGLGQWSKLLQVFPERYAYHEEQEALFNATVRAGKKPFTVLRDQSRGQVRPITLTQFRERVEAGETFDRGGTSCGCLLNAPNLFE